MPDGPPFIVGIHHFCDHRCWRCPLAARCRVHDLWRRSREPASLGKRPAARVAHVIGLSTEVTFYEISAMAELSGLSWDGTGGGPASGADVDVEREVLERERRGRDARASSLGTAAREYADLTLNAVRGLRNVIDARRHRDAADACDRIEETCLSIASKIRRALTSASGEDHAANQVQTDANGAAKVALLLIEESRQAWRLLMQPGTARGGGTPKAFVERLDALEFAVQQAFPRAMQFVRPGFDTGDAPGAGAEISRAMIEAFAPAKTIRN